MAELETESKSFWPQSIVCFQQHTPLQCTVEEGEGRGSLFQGKGTVSAEHRAVNEPSVLWE